MTVSAAGALVQIYDGDGVTTLFPFPVRFTEAAEVTVLMREDGVDTEQVLTTDYTLGSPPWTSGTDVTFLVAPPAGSKVIISRDSLSKQIVDLANAARNDAGAVEAQLDRMVMVEQDLAEKVSRAWKSDFGGAGQMIAAATAGMVAVFGAAGLEGRALSTLDPISLLPTAFMSDGIATWDSAATARADLGIPGELPTAFMSDGIATWDSAATARADLGIPGELTRRAPSSRDFTGANDDEILANLIAYCEANAIGRATVHSKTWNLTATIACGNVRLEAEKLWTVLNFSGTPARMARQTSSQTGGGLRGFDIRGNDAWTAFGISIAGADFELAQNLINGGSPRSTYRLIDIEATAVRPRVLFNRPSNAGSLIVVSTEAVDTVVAGNYGLTEYIDKGILVRIAASGSGPIEIDNNTLGVPANADGTYAKQPFAVNLGGGTSFTGYLYVRGNKAQMANVAHEAGTVNRGCADIYSFQACQFVIFRDNEGYGGGELGAYIGYSGAGRCICIGNTLENCDVGGIDFGVTADPVAQYNICVGNVVRNGAMDRLAAIGVPLADYYLVDQNRWVFSFNTGLAQATGANQTEYGAIFENCTEMIEGPNMFGRHATGRRKYNGTCTWLYRQPERWSGTKSAVTQGGGSVTNPSTGVYTITFGEPTPDANYTPVIASLAGTADRRWRITALATTGFTIEWSNAAGTLSATSFNWDVNA